MLFVRNKHYICIHVLVFVSLEHNDNKGTTVRGQYTDKGNPGIRTCLSHCSTLTGMKLFVVSQDMKVSHSMKLKESGTKFFFLAETDLNLVPVGP